MSKPEYSLDDLLYLMHRLRDPQGGCPWDLEQDFSSIVPHTLEEAYEVADAIERQDWDELPAELGDLLFQVVYYCQMAKEQELFDFARVISVCVDKLIRRHPHVFPDGRLGNKAALTGMSQQQLEQQWQQIKQQEQDAPQQLSLLDGVPLTLPAASRAVKLQKRAARVGFDWDDIGDVFAKLQEEICELQAAIGAADRQGLSHELGDVLFTVANLARKLEVDPEQALRQCNQRFYQRFNYMERQLAHDGQQIGSCNQQQLNRLWEQAKQHQQEVNKG